MTKEEAIKALSAEPCEDTISRKWLKNAIHNFYKGLVHTPTEEEIQKIQELEQAQLEKAYEIGKAEQQKTGHWKKSHDDIMQWWACSECGKPCPKGTYGGDFFSDYCPNCGAKMEESEE